MLRMEVFILALAVLQTLSSLDWSAALDQPH